jgi:NAD(P)H-hydrate epimerase
MDRAAIHGLEIAGYELMSRAGGAVFDDIRREFPELGRMLVMCGPGNNGGDGYVVARLAREAGIDVTVCSVTDPNRLKGDAETAHAAWIGAGGAVMNRPLTGEAQYDLALDALLGTGIDRPVHGEIGDAIDFLQAIDCPVYAVDIPSGLNSDTGVVMGTSVRCSHTMTFVVRKRGIYTATGPDYCGRTLFDDLGIPAGVSEKVSGVAGTLLGEGSLAGFLRPRRRDTHKGDYGNVFAVGGIAGMSGAIRLCGEAALRSGAGRVTLVTDPVHAPVINLACPELMVRAVTGGADCLPGGEKVIAVGPGLGNTGWSRELFKACIDDGAPLVVDADGLGLLAQGSGKSRDHWILTPHPGEAAQLLSTSTASIQQDRVTAAQEIARRFRACVVLKGCGTVVADADGRYAICENGNPGMATAGSGDVLTGVIVALLGQGLSVFEAACTGALAHAMAGDLAVRKTGEMALLAGDITKNLANVWKTIPA